jgi:tetratricopeptide (TPR) repeat protein
MEKEKKVFSPDLENPCDCCLKEGAFLRCGQCHSVYYCDRDCQKNHWKTHKRHCKVLVTFKEETEQQNKELENFALKYDENSKEACAICYEVVPPVEQLQLPCHHIFCSSCLLHYHTNKSEAARDCPLCRGSYPSPNLVQGIYENAVFYLRKANRFPAESDIHKQSVKTARREFDRLFTFVKKLMPDEDLERAPKVLPIHVSHLSLLMLEHKYEDVMEKSAEYIQTYSHELVKDLPLRLNLYLKLIEAKLKLGDPQAAIDLVDIIFRNDGPELREHQDKVKTEILEFYKVLLMACYETKQYQKGIDSGLRALDRNHYEDSIYEYIAFCYRGLGQWDTAITMMKKGIRYGQPWNPLIAEKYKTLTQQLITERENQQTSK